MNLKVFSIDDLYDLVSAQHSAIQLERETGMASGWYEFVSEDNYKEQFDMLIGHADEFEKALYDVACESEDDFYELTNLDEIDYETQEEFFEARREIQDNIIDKIYYRLGEYYL